MNRRQFIASSALAATAVLIGTVIPSDTPVLYADGVTDDAAALRAFLDGKDVVWPDGSPVPNRLSHKRFLLRDELHIAANNPSGRVITNSIFDFQWYGMPENMCPSIFGGFGGV